MEICVDDYSGLIRLFMPIRQSWTFWLESTAFLRQKFCDCLLPDNTCFPHDYDTKSSKNQPGHLSDHGNHRFHHRLLQHDIIFQSQQHLCWFYASAFTHHFALLHHFKLPYTLKNRQTCRSGYRINRTKNKTMFFQRQSLPCRFFCFTVCKRLVHLFQKIVHPLASYKTHYRKSTINK